MYKWNKTGNTGSYKCRLIMLQDFDRCSAFLSIKIKTPVIKPETKVIKPIMKKSFMLTPSRTLKTRANDKKQKPVTRSRAGRENSLISFSSIDLILFYY